MIEASASIRAVWEKNDVGCFEYTFSRLRLIASCSAMIDASSKRRQKSPAVVGSGSDAVPSPSRNTASVRRVSMSSKRWPPHSEL